MAHQVKTRHVTHSKGQTATEAAACLAAEKITDDQLQKTFDHTHEQGVIFSEILTPDGSEITRQELWNLAEKAENRKDASTAREYLLIFPPELDDQLRIELARKFARHIMQAQNVAVDINVHLPSTDSEDDEQREHHAHILTTTRTFANGTLNQKSDIELCDSDRYEKGLPSGAKEIEAIRKTFDDIINGALTGQAQEKPDRIPQTEKITEQTEFQQIPDNPEKPIGTSRKKERYNPKTVTDYGEVTNRNYDSMEFVKPGLVLGTVGSLVSYGGSGKTYMALENAVQIAIGREFIKGGVLYLPAEDPIDEIGKRLQAIEKAFELSETEKEDAAKNLKIWPLLGESPDLLEADEDRNQPLVDAICNIAKTYENDPLRIIFFDTLRRFSYADENDGGQMSKVLAAMETICKRVNCCCFFLHHASKAAALNGNMETQQAARGSSVLSDNIRYQEFMRGMNPEEAEYYGEIIDGRIPAAIGGERNRFVVWGVSKQNYGFPVKSRWYKRNNYGVLMPAEIGKFEKGSNGRHNNDY